MATTKTDTTIWTWQSLTAGGGDTTSSAVTLDDGYGAAVHIKLQNGATGPTLPAQVQIQGSADNSEWYNFGGPFVGGTGNSEIRSWGGLEIPVGVEYIRLVAGGNTGENVVVHSALSEVTSV